MRTRRPWPRRATPLPYGLLARVLFVTLDALYGKERTLSKSKVLALVARVPYQSWEQVAYIAIAHVHTRTGLARRIYERVRESRSLRGAGEPHLLLLDPAGHRAGPLPDSWLLFVVRPAWSYRLNADVEDHAEHEYMELVAEHPEWETTPFHSDFAADYGRFDSLADLLRQIGHDEPVHKEESVRALTGPRFR